MACEAVQKPTDGLRDSSVMHACNTSPRNVAKIGIINDRHYGVILRVIQFKRVLGGIAS